ncbi:MAG TPA: hypothetical protein DEG88_11540 [Propionibacteriaceae bacterium]|nr:hypothetical protein [Propionibacteriaceae bacterium]HBY23871.1 hypothetical protein [Propionibacteriaceae bacterium]
MSFAALAALALGAVGCTSSGPMILIGRADDNPQSAQVPALVAPSVNLDAGFTTSTTSSNAPTAPTVAAVSRVTEVLAAEGDRVTAGQVLVRFDDAVLVANVSAARATLAVAQAQVPVLDQKNTDAANSQQTVAANRKKATDAIATLTSTRASLVANLAQAKAALPQIDAGLAQLAAALKQLSGLPSTPQTQAQKTQLVAQQSVLKSKREQVASGIAQMTAGIATVDAGLAQANAGLAKLNSADASINEGRWQLRTLRPLLVVAADTAAVAVKVTEQQQSLAVVVAPTDGIVTDIASVGDVLAAGAPAVTVRPPVRTLTVWVAPAQAATLCVGDAATLVGDWAPAVGIGAKLALIGAQADYPPNEQATDEVHLTRAVMLQFAADAALPAGVPLEIRLSPCHPTR